MLSLDSLNLLYRQSGARLAVYLPDSDLITPLSIPDVLAGKCIYCRDATDGTERPDHPALQALGTRRMPLPCGAVCDACNDYVKELDRHVCNHNHIATMILSAGIIGSKGRIRRSLHEDQVFSYDLRTRTVTIRPNRRVSVERQGSRLAFSDPGPGLGNFDPWKFSRGLHRIALGVLAMSSGCDVALEERFDGVRNYIRRPKGRHEMWRYYQRPTDRLRNNGAVARAVAEGWYYFSFDLERTPALAYLNLIVDEFVVALTGSLDTVSPADVTSFVESHRISEDRRSTRPWKLL